MYNFPPGTLKVGKVSAGELRMQEVFEEPSRPYELCRTDSSAHVLKRTQTAMELLELYLQLQEILREEGLVE